MYIIFEGIDGCGKSTQVELLKQKYPDAITTKEPGGTPFGLEARKLLLHSQIQSSRAELLLFLADRAEHYKEVIAPNLERLIVSDRGFLSGIAYAQEAGFSLDFLIELNRFALHNNFPDRVVLFTIDKATLLQRVGSKEQDIIEQRGYEYLLRIQKRMIQTAEQMKLDFIAIDASLEREHIHKRVLEYINN